MLKLSLQSRGHSSNNLVKTLILNYSKCAAVRTVELPMGKVRGTHEEGHCGNDFYSFRGIPYGKPPIRDLRFSPTQPAEPWGNMVLDCTKDRSVPTQMGISSNQITGSEDCLYINVYTKHFDESEKKLPVIVNFTPGGFCTGGAITEKFGPQYLMREDIVYVMFNYRLSALGFLRINCPELGVSGNAGLHDHLTAMRWVQKYISYFNGDPDNVTIMGTSSGGAMVDFMMCAPQASGLFHRAVMMSGTMTCPWAIVPYADDLFCRLAWEKGYRGDVKATEILKFLRCLPAKEVVRLNHFGDCDYLFGHLYPFAPLVQAPSANDGGKDALIKGSVVEMYRTAWSVDVPLLIGGTSFEGLFMYPKYRNSKGKMLKMLKKNPALALPYEIHTKLSKTEREEAAEELMRFHFGHRPIDKNSVIQLLDFFSYKLFWHGIHRVVLSRLAHAKAPTFLYRFSYDSPTPIVRPYFTGKDITCGVCHAEDMAYLFPLKNRTPRMSEDENLITQRMVGILTTFARTGNPNCEETKSVLWKPLRNEDPFQAMLIDQKLKFGTQSEKEVLLMWDKLYDNHNSLLFGG